MQLKLFSGNLQPTPFSRTSFPPFTREKGYSKTRFIVLACFASLHIPTGRDGTQSCLLDLHTCSFKGCTVRGWYQGHFLPKAFLSPKTLRGPWWWLHHCNTPVTRSLHHFDRERSSQEVANRPACPQLDFTTCSQQQGQGSRGFVSVFLPDQSTTRNL